MGHQIILDCIHNYFFNVSQMPVDASLLDKYLSRKIVEIKFEFALVAEADVLTVINTVKSNSAGSDGISLNLVIYSLLVILSHITHSLNQFLYWI